MNTIAKHNLIQDKDAVIKMMEVNMRSKLSYIPKVHPTMEATELNSVCVSNCGMASDTFNTAFGGQVSKEEADSVYEYFRDNPMAWWISPSSESQQSQANLETAGFRHDEHDVGMVCDLTHLPTDYEPPKQLEIVRCTTEQHFSDFGEVLASIFDPVDEHVKSFYKKLTDIPEDNRADLILFVGYEGESAVSTSGLFLTDCAGIFDISTRPEDRKKGLGTAMFYRALQEAKAKSYEVSVLQSSPDGLGIYQRFGFEAICDFNVWTNV